MLDSMTFKFADLSIGKASAEAPADSPTLPSTAAVGILVSPTSNGTASNSERTLEDLGLYQRRPSMTDEYTRLIATGAAVGSSRSRTAATLDNIDNVMMEFRMNGAESSYDEHDYTQGLAHFGAGLLGGAMGPLPVGPQQVSAGTPGLPATTPGPILRQTSWPDAALHQGVQGSSTLDNFLNSLSAANDYANLLSREQQLRQLQLLAANPDLVSALLQSTRMHRDRRSRKPLPSECAFCKNNGEQESYYSSHTLKDWAGRVTCPVLRAFRCPRCGATADHAHTIKYCPESTDADHLPSIASLKSYRLASGKRRTPPSFSLQSPASPAWSQGTSTQSYPNSPSDLTRRPPLF